VLALTPGNLPDGETALTAAGGRNLGRGPENFEDAGDNGITNALQLARESDLHPEKLQWVLEDGS
jgi:hypothetical protein